MPKVNFTGYIMPFHATTFAESITRFNPVIYHLIVTIYQVSFIKNRTSTPTMAKSYKVCRMYHPQPPGTKSG